ncbi:PAS domain S-box protein [Tahibacter amnicola]|uniref:PAS domain S-box protein n=1 Tax=Tahibacter amnicola TaxID=2976241 RepID=A0ABY6BLD1_9GAMM|nr:PAS domain S-box protein [Tahibacter amnicola]UXI69845.1 PAS domain S-box protein [Tahibacter amnicola]
MPTAVVPRYRRILTALVATLLVIALFEGTVRLLDLPHLPSALMIGAIAAGYLWGLDGGLGSALMILAYAALVWQVPGGDFAYTRDDAIRLSILAFAVPGAAALVGFLRKLSADRLRAMEEEIQQRRTSEQALRLSEERFRAVADTTADGIITIGEGGRILYWNPAAYRMFGYQADEGLGQSLEILVPEQYRDSYRKGLVQYAASGSSPTAGMTKEYLARRKDGSLFPMELTLSTWQASGGVFFTGILRDISARKTAEAEREALAHFRSRILQHSLDVICTADKDGRFTMVSAACETMWGYAPEELQGRQYLEFVHPDDREATAAVAGNIVGGQPIFDFENRYIGKDGRVVPVMWSAQWSDEDQLLYAVARDMTERKRAEEERARTRQFIDTLKGLLSVCAWCNRIRREDGAWEKLECYVEKHSEAQFSHAMCPDCLARHYPDPD